MLEIALSNPKYHIDDREIVRGGVSYMVDTIESISKQLPSYNLYLIIGSDLLVDIYKWEGFSKIIGFCNIIVSYRENVNNMEYLNDSKISKNSLSSIISSDPAIFHGSSYGKIYLEKTTSVNISSTELRNKLKNKETVSNYIPSQLEEWLSKNKIY